MCWMLVLVCGFISQKSFGEAEKDLNHRGNRDLGHSGKCL